VIPGRGATDPVTAVAAAAARCTTAELATGTSVEQGDPTEIALLELAARQGAAISPADRAAGRRALFRFDPHLRLMTTIDGDGTDLVINTKGAPEAVVSRATQYAGADGGMPLSASSRDQRSRAVTGYAGQGLRVLAVARRVLPTGSPRRPGATLPSRTCACSGWSRCWIRPAPR
jgi:magnesium-transporting ATPase (P-type)